MSRDTPEVSVVVASRDRPVLLGRLLDALAAQTIDHARFEIVVSQDSSTPETEQVLRDHPLAKQGVLRHLTFEHGSKTPGSNRNAAWREATAPLIAITDDDCEPAPGWLDALLQVHQHEKQVLQGPTRPNPRELDVLERLPFSRTMVVHPPDWRAATCNIAYPRALLEEIGGFDETALTPGGEDTDLFLRARSRGARLKTVPDALVHHCVHPMTLSEHLRFTQRWMHLPYVIARHPYLRRHVFAGIFWKDTHAYLLLALAGAAQARRNPLALAALIPWTRATRRKRVPLAQAAAIDAAEIVAMVRGSIRYRTPFL